MDASVTSDSSAVRREFEVAETYPFVDCSRLRVQSIQSALDSLSASEASALAQLDINRDAIIAYLGGRCPTGDELAKVVYAFESGVDSVCSAAASKRAGLESELVAADAALCGALDVTAALVEVRSRH